MPPKDKTVEQKQVEDAPIVTEPATEPTAATPGEAEEWAQYLSTLDEFTREQVNLADSLEVQYRTALEQREANREILRFLAKQGKVDQRVVDSFYPPKVMTKPRRKKDETDEDYAARVAAATAETNGNGNEASS